MVCLYVISLYCFQILLAQVKSMVLELHFELIEN